MNNNSPKNTIVFTISDQLEWLVANTTVKWIECKQHCGVVYGEKIYRDRFQLDQGQQVDFDKVLEPLWQKKFEDMGYMWDRQYQLYRALYTAMRGFWSSFEGFRVEKVSAINSIDNKSDLIHSYRFASSHLFSMYTLGKRAVDLLSLIEKNDSYSYDRDFCGIFAETRNKLFEHAEKPNIVKDLFLEPNWWSLIATDSSMPILIHTKVENEYTAYIDYYQDYYDLEKQFVSIVKSFASSNKERSSNVR